MSQTASDATADSQDLCQNRGSTRLGQNSSPSFFRRILDRIEPGGVEPEQIPRLLHMRRQRGADIDQAAARMRDHDPARQQVQPVLDAAGNLPVLLCKILWI